MGAVWNAVASLEMNELPSRCMPLVAMKHIRDFRHEQTNILAVEGSFESVAVEKVHRFKRKVTSYVAQKTVYHFKWTARALWIRLWEMLPIVDAKPASSPKDLGASLSVAPPLYTRYRGYHG